MNPCTIALCFDLLLGASRESQPPNGTWWQSDQYRSFHQTGPSYGLALTGNQWSLSAERMARMTSTAVACGDNEPACKNGSVPYSHWYGRETPLGVWAAWEPRYGSVFAQLGAGVVWSDFRMHVPDWAAGGSGPPHVVDVGNNALLPSPLAGIGYRAQYADVLLNWRLVRTTNGHEIPQQNFQGLGWNVFNLSIRIGVR